MPTSWYQAASVLMEKIMVENPASVLDVGIGFGKYGVLLREALDVSCKRYDKSQWAARIDGIEAFENYRNPLHDFVYNTVVYQPLAECLDTLGSYDVIVMIDVLAHFSKEEGLEMLKKLLAHTKKALIVSTPLSPAEQSESPGHVYEARVSRWKAADFSKFKSDITMLPIDGNQALIVKILPAREP